MTDRAAFLAELGKLEVQLLATWSRGPGLRARWTPDPCEQSSPRTAAIARACSSLAARGATSSPDLGPAIVTELGASGQLSAHWPMGAAILPEDTLSDPDQAIMRWRRLRRIFALRERVVEVVSTWSPAMAREPERDLQEAIRAHGEGASVAGYSDEQLMALALEQGTKPRVAPLFTGFPQIDTATGGLCAGHVWVLAAQTNWGKTHALLSMIDHCLQVHGGRALLVSCEDAPELIAGRLVARRTRMSATSIRDGRVGRAERGLIQDEILRAAQRGPAPVFLDGRGHSVENIASAVSAAVRTHGVMLVGVDYLQCIGTKLQLENRRLTIQHVARTLTDAIKGSGAAGVLTSQVTDEHVRDSKDVEHAAEVVLIGRCSRGGGAKSLYLKKNKTGPVGVVNWVELDSRSGAMFTCDPPAPSSGDFYDE